MYIFNLPRRHVDIFRPLWLFFWTACPRNVIGQDCFFVAKNFLELKKSLKNLQNFGIIYAGMEIYR